MMNRAAFSLIGLSRRSVLTAPDATPLLSWVTGTYYSEPFGDYNS